MRASPLHRPTRRAALLAAAAGVPWLLSGCPVLPRTPAAQRPERLRLLAHATVPHRLPFRETPIGGLSGIDYDAAKAEYLLLCDDRSDLAPARMYTLRWAWPAAPQWIDVALLRQADGRVWPGRGQAQAGVPVPDPEGVRLQPDTGTVLWASEGDFARGFGPAFYEARRDGSLMREFALPAMFSAGDRRTRGTRDNLGFEGLALTPDGQHAWLAMEGALFQDGPVPTVLAPGGPCRLTQIDLASARALRQIAYVPDTIPLRPLPPGGFADNGISEILMLDAHCMLVLERAYAIGAGNSLRLYEIDTRDATETLAIDALAPGNHRAAAKTLVADFATLGLPRLDNTEGMCWGPTQANGRRTLVVVSDDNFNPQQITQFAAFEFIEGQTTLRSKVL